MLTRDHPEQAALPPFRLAEILAPLSLVTDLGMGLPDEQAMRSCVLATALARESGLDSAEAAHVYYVTLLQHLGCTATAHEEARHVGGDQLAIRPLVSHTDERLTGEMFSLLSRLGQGRPPLTRMRIVIGMLDGVRWGPPVQAAVCEVAARLAARLAMPDPVQEGLSHMFERWDGKGGPRRLRGAEIALSTRFAQVASRAVALHGLGGAEAALAGIRASGGGWLDPEIAATFEACGARCLGEIETQDAFSAVLQAEPEPHRAVPRQALDEVARAFADQVDLLSPFTHGHSTGVALLAEAAAAHLDFAVGDRVTLRRAALLHDLGRVALPAGIWEKPGPLSTAEWERVRLHAYFTERILARAPLLTREAAVAGMHHERLDGSGYHRGAGARDQSDSARVLAAADAYHAMTEERPYRPAFAPEHAADRLVEEVRLGRLGREAVEAVLAAAGEVRRIGPPPPPAGLSEREVEVLRLIAAGRSNREIATSLVISPRTAEHHVQHVYAKIGVSTRAGATLFALDHGLARGQNGGSRNG